VAIAIFPRSPENRVTARESSCPMLPGIDVPPLVLNGDADRIRSPGRDGTLDDQAPGRDRDST